MRHRRELKPSAIKRDHKEVRSLLGDLVHWWQHLTTRQRIILLTCILLVIGASVAVFLRVPSRSNNTAKEKKLVRRSEFFSNHSRKCVPLTERPEETEHNKNTPVTYLPNTLSDCLSTLRFGYEDNLLSEHYYKRYSKKDLFFKITKLREAIINANLSDFQKIAISGTQFRIVRGEEISNSNALTEAASGNIYINIDLDPKGYKSALENELSHVEVRYINLVKCGVKLPENTLLAGYPFINPDWQINPELQDELETCLKNGHQKVVDYFRSHNPTEAVSEYGINLRNNIDELLTTAYQLPFTQALEEFYTSFYSGITTSDTLATDIGGKPQRLTEQVSNIREFPPAVQHYFYSDVADYLRKYYAMSCTIESENSSSNQPRV